MRRFHVLRATVAVAMTAATLTVGAPMVPVGAGEVETTTGTSSAAVATARADVRTLGTRMEPAWGRPAATPRMAVPGALPVPADAPRSTEAQPSDNRSAGDQSGTDQLEGDPPPGPLPQPDAPPVSASFQALGDNGTRIPPDTHGAVGPNHAITTLNSEIRIQSRTGTIVNTFGLASFWSGLGVTDVFDPRVVYDPYGARFLMTAVAERRSAGSSVLIGVSSTSDATSTWHQYRFDADSTDTSWADYPSFGFNTNWVAVNVNRFTNSTSSFVDSRTFVFPRVTLESLPPNFTASIFGHTSATIVPAVHFSSTLTTMHLLQRWNGNSGGSGYLRLYTITGPIGSEVLTTGALVSAAAPWAGSPPGGDFAPQLGSAQKIDNNDDRMQSVVYRNGSLWAAHTVFLPATGATRSAVQWWQINPSTAAVQQRARIEDPTGARFFAFPSIAVNASNDVLIGYSRFSATQYASGNYSFRYATDPANTLQTDTVFKAGEAPYYKTFTGTRNRWGDYSATVVDPTNDIDLWTIQEYAATPSGGTDRWGTWWTRLSPNTTPLAGMSVTPSSISFGIRQVGSPSGSSTITVSSTGAASLAISSATLGGTNPGDFAKTSDTCTGASVTPGTTCTIGVRFSPTAGGTRTAALTLAGNVPSQSVSLTGTGDAAAPVSSFTTANNAVLLPGGLVAGATTDDAAGVSTVAVTFTPVAGTPTSVSATLSCNATRSSCSWTAAAPLVPGQYTVRARGTDLVGRTESPGPAITVIVV